MKIIVCIKQVPDAKDIQWTSNNTMKREGVEGVINACDLYAIETALEIKKKNPQTQIIVFSMGPMQAENILRQAIALGADEAFLICDKIFSGSDTLATGLTLSSAIKAVVPDFDIVFCGQYASDGDTAQTGVEIAENLNAFQVTYALDVLDINEKSAIVSQDCEDYIQSVEVPLPAVVCVMENKTKQLSDALIIGQMRAQDAQIKILTFNDLELKDNQVGIKGSPTYVSNVFRPKINRKCEIIDSHNAIEFAMQITEKVLKSE